MKRADQRKFHYIYKITRNDGKFYIGMHSTDDLEDGYFGSGQRLWKSINKHGKEKHSKEILEFLPNRKELKDRERELVCEELIGTKRCMNLKLGGEGGWDHIDIRGDKNPMRRPEVVEKVRAKAINPSDELRKMRSENMKRTRAGMIEPRAGKKHTAVSKALMSVNRLGKGGWSKGLILGQDPADVREKKRIAAIARVESGFDMGSLGRGKKYNMVKRACPWCGKLGTGGMMTRYHFDNCRSNSKA